MKILVAFATLLLCSCGLFTTAEKVPTLSVANAISIVEQRPLGIGDSIVIGVIPNGHQACVVYSGLGMRCKTWLDSFHVSHGSHEIYLANQQRQILLAAQTLDTLLVSNNHEPLKDSAAQQIDDVVAINSRQYLLNQSEGSLMILDSSGSDTLRHPLLDSFNLIGRSRSNFWKKEDGKNCLVESDLSSYKVERWRILCVDSNRVLDSLPFGSGLPDSLYNSMYLPLAHWKGLLWNLVVWRRGGSTNPDYVNDDYFNAQIALASMDYSGEHFTIGPFYDHNDGTSIESQLVANDALGAYVILAENYPMDNANYGKGALLTIYRADSKNVLQQIKRYHVDGISLGIKTAWAVDANHFAVVLNNSFWNDGADNIMLFDKNGNVVKGL